MSQYIAMLNEDVAKVREAKGKKPLKASEKAVEVKDTNVSNTDPESGYMHRDTSPKVSSISTTAQSMVNVGLF